MPKEKKSLSIRLNAFVSEFGGNVFSIDSRVLFCKYCETKIDSERRSSVVQHLKTEKHLRSVKRKEDQKNTKCQQLLTHDLSSKKSKINMDLCIAMISANIPFNKLSNVEIFRSLFWKRCPHRIGTSKILFRRLLQ